LPYLQYVITRLPIAGFSHILRERVEDDISSLSYDSYVRYSDSAATRAGMDIEVLDGDVRLYSRGTGRPSVFIISGQHGDERAGPVAVLQSLIEDDFPPEASVRICPITNPIAWDEKERKPDGLDMNRVWSLEEAPPHILYIMMSMEADRPYVFLDLHESHVSPGEGGESYDLRHTGTPWGHSMASILDQDVAETKINKRIPGSSREYAYRLGVEGVAVVETYKFLPIESRVQFHREVMRRALDPLLF
jgi:hypothetical protein